MCIRDRSEDGTHKVMMDKEAFTNRIRGYQSLADRMRDVYKRQDMYCEEAIRDRIVKEDIAFYKSKQEIGRAHV